MKVSGPPLLPILRSENQARLLTAILLSPEREFTLSEPAKEVGVSLSTVTREIPIIHDGVYDIARTLQ